MPIIIAYVPDSVIKIYCFQEFIMEFEFGEIKDMHAVNSLGKQLDNNLQSN